MEIKEALGSLVKRVGGGIASVLISSEGEIIEFYSDDKSHDLEWIGARYGVVVRDILSTVKRLDQGVVRSIVVELDRGSLVVTPLGDLFFLILLIDQEGNLGQAAFHGRMAALALEKELAL